MAKAPKPSEQRIVLEKVSWQQFETLLADMGADRSTRFTFDRGRLELMTPLEEHRTAAKTRYAKQRAPPAQIQCPGVESRQVLQARF